MGAGIEWKLGILRTGRKFLQYKDPYEFSCEIIRIGDIALLEGGTSNGDSVINRKEIRKVLKDQGFKSVEFTKIRNGKEYRFKKAL